MRTISRRLGRLEDKFGVAETEFTRHLAVRLEAGRRAAESRAHDGYPARSRENFFGLTVEQILLRGRQRAAGRHRGTITVPIMAINSTI